MFAVCATGSMSSASLAEASSMTPSWTLARVQRRPPGLKARGHNRSSRSTCRARVPRRRDQLRGDAADAAVEDQAGAAAEVEHDLFQPDLAGLRRVRRMQLALFEADAAGRQKFAVEPSLAQGEVDPRALRAALAQIDAGPDGGADRRLEMPPLPQLGGDRRARGRLRAGDRDVSTADTP